jgi:TPR repeat protein
VTRFLLVLVFGIVSIQVLAENNDELNINCKTQYSLGNYKEAYKLCSLSAEQGHTGARYNLGNMYDFGDGVTQDYKQAVKWYKLAAEQGDADAQFNLGVMYDNGKGVTQDYKQAVKWYKLAAEQGDADAQFNLGLMYYRGDGVTQDNVYAHMWFNIAGSNGNSLATKSRDIVAKDMTKEQIAEAQKLARECVAKDYKDC